MLERGKTYPISEFERLLKEDMATHGFLDPHSLIMAARAKQAEFEAAVAPAEVVFDTDWSSKQDAPRLGVGFAYGGEGERRYHAITVSQRPDFSVVDEALAYVQKHADALKAKVGA